MSKLLPITEFRLTDHAKFEMNRRGISSEEILERLMKVVYDSETDTLSVILAEAAVAESDEEKPGVILDYDSEGNLVSLEILDASRRVGMPTQIEYQVIPTTRHAA